MKTDSKLKRYLTPFILIAIGIVFVFYGATDGEAKAVLIKAIAICMECIGIG
ncbi:MAG: hypothetical protein II124_06255 [Clostridia bacterium]|nr:hypothetical protein [Clostridia bacterium]